MYLNCHSYFSLHFGTIPEDELLRMAQEMGFSELALTDINNTSAVLNFIRLAPQYGIKPIAGIDFRNGAKQLYVGIATNNNAFLRLNEFLSAHIHKKEPFPEQAPQLDGCYFIYPFEQLIMLNKQHFELHEYIGINTNDLKKLRFTRYFNYKDRLVMLQPVNFRHKRDFNVHRLLRAIDNNTLLSKLPKTEEAQEWEKMFDKTKLQQAFAEYPDIIANTQHIIDTCHIEFDFSENRKPQNQKTYTGNNDEDTLLLQKLCEEGLKYRYQTITEEITSRLKKELNLIHQMGFVSYFLINWDIIQYAHKCGYFHVGRGSGANSIVAYLLQITDVDPIDLDLYFERFINLYRTSPPDFDIDFSSHDRQDVTRYILERFTNSALLGSYVTFQHRGAIRELGKVFGLPDHEIEALSAGKHNYSSLDEIAQLVLKYAQYLHGMPNHRSVHAGGILISEKPINYLTATDLPPKGFPTTQFDMVIAEDVGLYKFDILGQRGLAKIKEALYIIAENRPDDAAIDIHDIKHFKNDTKVNNMIKEAQCLGCFYVESPAMRMLLKKLRVDNYLGLVAASSIIRPGVAQSGMMREYILRHRYPERRKEAHPVLYALMPETYGVMVYQEDVIKVAHHFAGLTLGEADVLRRAMSGKYRSREEFSKVHQRFMTNCASKGYTKEVTQSIWHQIESFAGYAFAKGHSASYAVESYQTLFLKAYYPLEYMVAVLNNGGGFYRPEVYIHEARMLGATIEAPCINHSNFENRIEDKTIYLGFHHLKNLDHNIVGKIENERLHNGAYTSLDDFFDRIHIGIEQVSLLIRCGAFRFYNPQKRELLWQAHLRLQQVKPSDNQKGLFQAETRKFDLPNLISSEAEEAFDQMELFGFALTSPFSLLANPLPSVLTAHDMRGLIGKNITICGYLVTYKNARTSNKKTMYFGTFIDTNGHFIDTVHFPPSVARWPFRGKGVYCLKGKVVEEFDFLSVEVNEMQKLDLIPDPRFAENSGNKKAFSTEKAIKRRR